MLTVTTINLGPKSVTPDVVEAMLREALAAADIVNVQEAGRRVRRRVLRRLRPTRTGRHPGPRGNASQHATSILWDPAAIRVTARTSRRLNRRTWVGQAGAGGPVAVSRYVNHIRAVDETGEATHVLNAHLIPSTQRRGLPKGNRRRRMRVYRRQVRGICRVLDTIPAGARVVLTMDANGGPDHPLLRPLRNRGLRTVATGPTHGNRQIDLVWTRGVRIRYAGTRPTASDHRAVTVTVR